MALPLDIGQLQATFSNAPIPIHSPMILTCATDTEGQPMICHLLACGHVVAIDDKTMRCALNCLYIAQWMSDHPGMLPQQGHQLAHDNIYCEVCEGIPIMSYDKAHPKHSLRRALVFRRDLMGLFYSSIVQQPIVAKEVFGVLAFVYAPPEYKHRLHCNHTVVCPTARECAANCDVTCPHPLKINLGDIIPCYECVLRAERVYSQYLLIGGGAAREVIAKYHISYNDPMAIQNAEPISYITTQGQSVSIASPIGPTILGPKVESGHQMPTNRLNTRSKNGSGASNWEGSDCSTRNPKKKAQVYEDPF
ncbi:hypothetical protein P280DRAFT_289018 [Massarina eburnea CBS 473.64]|uniref:Uncharacterized protein n=1 Tax=Massarina eburnea CBS 473.64 TaxID=1395130 RepID=A0A6A6S2B1_9PLEO|nr:hypothetical protein P280DRAFT_289018 [Massarina eburnea CBS 473.64]